MDPEIKGEESPRRERTPEGETRDRPPREREEPRDMPPREREAEKVKGGAVGPCFHK